MKIIKLTNPKKSIKRNSPAPDVDPNVTEDCFFEKDGKVIWFYLKKAPENIIKRANLSNQALRGDGVPKTVMSRVIYVNGVEQRLKQYSTIIGWVAAANLKRRYQPGYSHVHLKKGAQTYIKLMYKLSSECEKLVKDLMPDQYEKQKKLLWKENIRIWNLFTSSIANYNTSANYHIDHGNITWANNIIITQST